MGRTPCCQKQGIKKGPWTPEEDQKLVAFIVEHGHGNWRALPKKCGLLRCGKSCRLRWTNYLRPDIKRGQFSHKEEQKIIHLHALVGNKWAFIASQLPKRTDNEIKNYWNTVLKKRVQRMGLNGVPLQQKEPDSVSSSESRASGSTLSHLVQWESARLEAEARLAKESTMRAKGAWMGIPFRTDSSPPSHAPQMPSNLQEARVLRNQSSSSVHPMRFASNMENSLHVNQRLRATTISSSNSGSALSNDSVEFRAAKSNSSSAQEFNSALKLTSNGSITWNSHELLPKDSTMMDFLRFSKVCPQTLNEGGAVSDPGDLFAVDKALQSVKKGEQTLTLHAGPTDDFSELHELLFGDDSGGSCLSPSSTTPWSQSVSHDASIHGIRTDMEDVRESEETTTKSSQLILQAQSPRDANVGMDVNIFQSSVKHWKELEDDKGRGHSLVFEETGVEPSDSLLPQYDSIIEENSIQWNIF